MLLRHWLAEMGSMSRDRCSILDVKHFAFGMDAYRVVMLDGREFQDNDLERILSVLHDEFNAHNATQVLTQAGRRQTVRLLHPTIDYAAPTTRNDPLGQRSKLELIVRPGEMPQAAVPAPELAPLVDMLRERVTLFNLTGEWTSYGKNNL